MLGFIKKLLAVCVVAILATGYFSGYVSNPVLADVNYDEYLADYTEINYVSHEGNPIKLYVSGTSVGVQSTCISSGKLVVRKNNSFSNVGTSEGSGSFTLDLKGKLSTSEIYTLKFTFTADGTEQTHEDLYIGLDSNGDVRFIKSLVYDYNVERCSEWWTDEQSLNECLQPQNDIECDNPLVIAYAEEITKGCTNDWEKAEAIYQHVINFAYDDIQIVDESMVYQDDVLSLLRRRIAICEGLGNTFVALCRASGIPACVCFGIGTESSDLISDESYLETEDPNHAWAAVFLGGTWYSVDPTWDISFYYEGTSFWNGEWEDVTPTLDWFLVPLEDFSMTHKICDADTTHSIEQEGSCGESSSYKITRDGTITFYGSGEIKLPAGVNGFRYVEFDPDSNITSIGEECFIDCDIITSIILPDSVTRIEDFAFNTCEDLEYIYLPEGLTYIGQEAFDYCDELAYVYVPDSVQRIAPYAFDDCSRLIISIPSHLEGFEFQNYVGPAKIIVR